MTRAARIVLADDHELFREGIASLLSGEDDLDVVGQVGDGLEVLTAVRDLKPDLTIMDISMPMCDGLEATRLIRARYPHAKILILTVHEEEEKLFDAIRAGASGYLLKSLDSSGFLLSVRGALRGEVHLPPRMAAALLDEFSRLSEAPPASAHVPTDLTPREMEVLQLIATRATDKEIAAHLTLSVHTVKTHVRNILTKLHAVNRRDASRLAAEKGLLNGDRKP